MEEYRMDKCPTCGREKRGPRVIRLSKEHATKWEDIQRQLDRNTLVTFLGGLLLGIASATITALAAWWYLPLPYVPHGSTESRVIISVVLGCLGWVFTVFVIWLPIRTRRKDKPLLSQMDIILREYGIRKDYGEPFIVVTK